jgi:cyclase
MISTRIIPRLDIKGPNLVKGVHLEGLRVLGRPEWFAQRYYEGGADELICLDTVASLYGRNHLVEIVSRAAERIYIPLTVGGGVRSLEDIRQLLRAGADKVAINTAAIRDPQLIRAGAEAFGSQCMVLSIAAKRREPGRYECLVENARERTGLDVFDWVRRAVELGAGEVLLTSVDQEGTGRGYDLELISRLTGLVEVPVIASGGAGSASDVERAILEGRADAVSAASLFHYALIDEAAEEATRFEEGNVEFLQGRLPITARCPRAIQPMRLAELKARLAQAGVPIRPGQTTVSGTSQYAHTAKCLTP